MFDTLPFPNITAKDAEERSKQTVDYLIQFKEELEFILNAIVSGEYEKATTQPTKATSTVVNTDTSSDNGVTIAQVVNSTAFKGKLDEVREEIPKEYLVSAEQIYVSNVPGGVNLYRIVDSSGAIEQFQVQNGRTPNVSFKVNFETGNLEYTVSIGD